MESERRAFPFLHEEANQTLLQWQHLHNVVHLGHRELTRATLRQLWSAQEDHTRQFVASLLRDGLPAHAVSLKSADHIYLLLTIHQEWNQRYPSSAPPLQQEKQISFDLLLIDAAQQVEQARDHLPFFRYIRALYMSMLSPHENIIQEELGADLISAFRAWFMARPRITLEILRALLCLDDLHNNQGQLEWGRSQQELLGLYLDWLDQTIDLASSTHAMDAQDDHLFLALSYLHIVPPRPITDESIEERLRAVFQRLLRLRLTTSAEDKARLVPLSGRERYLPSSTSQYLYQALLASGHTNLIRLFLEGEEASCHESFERAMASGSLMKELMEIEEEHEFWARYEEYCRINQVHPLTRIVRASWTLLQRKETLRAFQWTRHFSFLRPYLLVASWTYYQDDVTALEEFVRLFLDGTLGTIPSCGDEEVMYSCHLLVHHLSLSRWIEARAPAPCSVEHVLKSLRSRSLLHVLIETFAEDQWDDFFDDFRVTFLAPSPTDAEGVRQYKQQNDLQLCAYRLVHDLHALSLSWHEGEDDKEGSERFQRQWDSLGMLWRSVGDVVLQGHLLSVFFAFVVTPSSSIPERHHHHVIQASLSLLQELTQQLEDSLLSSTKGETHSTTRDQVVIMKKIWEEAHWRFDLLHPTWPQLWKVWSAPLPSLLLSTLREEEYTLCQQLITRYPSLQEHPLAKVFAYSHDLNTLRQDGISSDSSDEGRHLAEHFLTCPTLSFDGSFPREAFWNALGTQAQWTDTLQEYCAVYSDLLPSQFVLSGSLLDGCPEEQRQRLWPSSASFQAQQQLWNVYDELCPPHAPAVLQLSLTDLDRLQQLLAHEEADSISPPYLPHLLTLLQQLARIFHPTAGPEDLLPLDFIKYAPDEMIGRQVYEKEDFERAGQLAHLFHQNLVAGLIRSIQRSAHQESEAQEERVVLTEKIVSFLHSYSPLVAMLACLYLAPLRQPEDLVQFLPRAESIQQSDLSHVDSLQAWMIEEHITPRQYLLPAGLDQEKLPRAIRALEEGDWGRFYQYIAEGYTLQGKAAHALDIYDQFLLIPPPDSLFEAAVVQCDTPRMSWRYILRLDDTSRALSLAYSQMEHWSLAECVETLATLASHATDETQSKQAQAIIHELEVYQKMMEGASATMTWQQVAARCRRDPASVIDELIDQKNWEVARQVALLFAPSLSVQRSIEVKFLLTRLREEAAPHEAFTVNESATTRYLEDMAGQGLHVAESMIDHLAQSPPSLVGEAPTQDDLRAFQTGVEQFLAIQLFLIQYLLSHCEQDTQLEQFSTALLRERQIGLKILQQLSMDMIENYLHLAGVPRVLIEALLASEQTPEVAKILETYPHLYDDALILFYCHKAMYVPHSDEPTPPEATYQPVHSRSSLRQIRRDFISVRHSSDSARYLKKFVVVDGTAPSARLTPFTGEETHDQKQRDAFRFPSTPNIRLFKSIISLSRDQRSAAQQCLQLANELSEKLSASGDPLFVTDQIQQVLLTGKFLLLEAGLASDLADRLLDHLSIIQSLIIQHCGTLQLRLLDFDDRRKTEYLRDRLIKDDHLQLALEISEKCHLDPSSVYASWGLSLLRAGAYTKAKEKLMLCLKDNPESGGAVMKARTRGMASPMQSQAQAQSRLVNDIIRILEKKPMRDTKNLRQEQRQRVRNRLLHHTPSRENGGERAPASPVPRLVPNQLDTERYMQCVFYLTRYGTADDCVAFWLRHNNFEDAMRFILTKRMSGKLFIETAMKVIRVRGITFLHENILLRVDPSLDMSQPYLMKFCGFLSSMKAEEALFETQIFMGDHVRAGLTCVSKAKRAEEPTLQIKLLRLAEESLQNAIQSKQSRRSDSPLSEEETGSLLRACKLQVATLELFMNAFHGKIPPHLASLTCLSRDPDSIAAQAEMMISLGHFRVAYPLLQEFSDIVDKQQVYFAACARISRAKKYTTLTEILRLLRPMGTSDEDINDILKGCAVIFMQNGDPKSADKLLVKITELDVRVAAFLQCGKLEKAFLDSARAQRADLVQLVQEAAQKHNARNVFQMCSKYFRDHRAANRS